jgi:putative molybdopterin biosynthesis protein
MVWHRVDDTAGNERRPGCDLALALLGAHLTRRYSGYRLIWVESSSLAALGPLGCADAHAAGRHLWEPETGESNIPYVRRELFGRRLGIVTFSEWQQGLIVARGNPSVMSGRASSAGPDITLVNREPGAGSWALLDLWLQGVGVTTA